MQSDASSTECLMDVTLQVSLLACQEPWRQLILSPLVP
jgi:hypothetical protein